MTTITELTELDPERVDGVQSPANGTPFLLLKAVADEECETCDGSGKIKEGNVDCPDCEGEGTVSKSDEAAEWDALDKALSSADRKDMPNSSFAYVDSKGNKHLPVHDKGHVKAALGRFKQQDFTGAEGDTEVAEQKAAAKIKTAAEKHGIKVNPKSTVAEAASKSTVQDALDGTKTPEEGAHIPSGHSSVQGPVVTGTAPKVDPADTVGGETTAEIPLEDKVNTAKSTAVASLAEAIDLLTAQRQAISDGESPNTAVEALASAGIHIKSFGDEPNNKPAGSGKEIISMDVTQDELVQLIAAGSASAVKAALDAEKESNNDGDLTEAEIKPTKTADADDVNAVKETDETVAKATATQLEDLTKQMSSIQELVTKIAKRPRTGGPSLDGQSRIPASEGRLEDVAKSGESDAIQGLMKQLETTTDPQVRDNLGLQITHQRLMQINEGR